jgi:hypothetical protein
LKMPHAVLPIWWVRLKTFTHMDQGHGKQYADIHNGIRNTLTMLQYKIKKGNITVRSGL